jgi:transglutaminase-like putative cysteine protease
VTAALLHKESLAHDRGALRWVLGACAFALVPILSELPWWVAPVFAVSAGFRLSADRFRWKRPGRVLKALLAVLLVVLVLREFRTLLGRDAGLTLLTCLLGFKFLEIDSRRDYLLSVFLCFLVTLGGFLYEQTLLFGLHALTAVFVNTCALIRLTQPTGLTNVKQVSVATRLFLPALPVMLVLYFFFPRLPGALWSVPGESTAGRTGLSDTLRPGSINSLLSSGQIIFRVSFEAAAPPLRELYFRARVLSVTDGVEWREHVGGRFRESIQPLSEPTRYEIIHEAASKPWLPALDLPGEVPPNARTAPGFALEARDALNERARFRLTSYTRYRTHELSTREERVSLQLPPVLSPRVAALAQQFKAENTDARATVNAVLQFIRQENFRYTLTPPLMRNDPVDEFLFEARAGFCEHYASAFVTLMRAAGIPARVVMGYQGGEYNASGNYFIVRALDAHAWAEVWLENQGWTRVDPTAAVAPERVELGMDAVRRLQESGAALGDANASQNLGALQLGLAARAWLHTRLAWDLANVSWYRWVADYGPERQQRFLDALGLSRFSLSTVAVGAVLVIFAWLVLTLKFSSRGQVPRDVLGRAFQRFCQKLARHNVRRQPHEGALVLVERAARANPALRAPVSEVVQRYYGLRYGTACTRETAKEFAALVRGFKA